MDWLPIRRQSIATVRLEGQRALFCSLTMGSGKNTVLPKGIIDLKMSIWDGTISIFLLQLLWKSPSTIVRNKLAEFFSVFDCSAVSCTLTALTLCDHLSMQLGIVGIRLWMVILFVFFYGKETIFYAGIYMSIKGTYTGWFFSNLPSVLCRTLLFLRLAFRCLLLKRETKIQIY